MVETSDVGNLPFVGDPQRFLEGALHYRRARNERIAPLIFLEDVEVMRKRLVKTIEQFGANRVLCAVPECGLRSFARAISPRMPEKSVSSRYRG